MGPCSEGGVFACGIIYMREAQGMWMAHGHTYTWLYGRVIFATNFS